MFPQKVPSVSGDVMACSLGTSHWVIPVYQLVLIQIVKILYRQIVWSRNGMTLFKAYRCDTAVVFKVCFCFNVFLIGVLFALPQKWWVNITFAGIDKIRNIKIVVFPLTSVSTDRLAARSDLTGGYKRWSKRHCQVIKGVSGQEAFHMIGVEFFLTDYHTNFIRTEIRLWRFR